VSNEQAPHELVVAATHFVAAKLVLSAPEFSDGDRRKAAKVLVQTTEQLSTYGYDPDRGHWLPSRNTPSEAVDGPRYGIPQSEGEYGLPVTGDSYRKAIMQLYSSLLCSNPHDLIS